MRPLWCHSANSSGLITGEIVGVTNQVYTTDLFIQASKLEGGEGGSLRQRDIYEMGLSMGICLSGPAEIARDCGWVWLS